MAREKQKKLLELQKYYGINVFRLVDIPELVSRISPLLINHQLVLEVGCGRGEISWTLINNFNNVVATGIDIRPISFLPTLRKINPNLSSKIFFIDGNFFHFSDLFPLKPNIVYFPFPDPYPKNKHAKKRLLSPYGITKLVQVTTPSTSVIMCSDNKHLWHFTMEVIKEIFDPIPDYKIWTSQELPGNLSPWEKILLNVSTKYKEKYAFNKVIYYLSFNPATIKRNLDLNYKTLAKLAKTIDKKIGRDNL